MKFSFSEFEIRLRSQNSDDPLALWCDYIHWIEQSFPRQPREGKLHSILRKCLNKFKDKECYMNDVRFVKLCIKYVSKQILYLTFQIFFFFYASSRSFSWSLKSFKIRKIPKGHIF